MIRSIRYIIFSLLVVTTTYLHAQNITGTWEGDLGDDQFLQMNIMQKGDKLCGYTWDYVKRDKRSYCKAYFQGRYDKKNDEWLFQGMSFIESSEAHFLMRLRLSKRFVNGEVVLEGISVAKSILFYLLTGGWEDSVRLKKISSRPQQFIPDMYDCFPEVKKSKDTVALVPIADNNKDSIVTVKQPDVKKTIDTAAITTIPEKKTDSIEALLPAFLNNADSIKIPRELAKRKNKEQSHLEVNMKTITLNVYDNALIDGDTVSIFYNNRLLLSHQRLSEKPIVINLELDEKQTRHEIILFAENLGSIPPNTALIVIYAGKKRYELFSSASLEENAVLVFDYVPK